MYILQMAKLEEKINAMDAQQWVQIFPRGKVYIEHYDETLNCNDEFYKQMMIAFESKTLHKPFIDVNHEFKESYGSIDYLEIREKGLFAAITLNENGVKAIKNNEYKYISPAFGNVTDNKGNKYENALIAVTLTNIPALQGTLPTLQEQLKLSGQLDDIKILSFEKPHKNGGKTMKKLANFFGLNAEASEDSIINEAEKKIQTLEVRASKAEKSLEAVKLERDTAVNELEKASEKLKAIELEAHEKEKKAFFDSVREEGKVEIKELEMWENHYDENKDFVIKVLSARTAKPKGQQTTTSGGDSKKLTAEDEAIMLDRGMDPDNPEDAKKYLEWNKE